MPRISEGGNDAPPNVLWCDGRASSARYTPAEKSFNGQATVEKFHQHDVGYLIHPAYPKDSPNEDYYFLLRKPS
jgi:hypothetical protein